MSFYLYALYILTISKTLLVSDSKEEKKKTVNEILNVTQPLLKDKTQQQNEEKTNNKCNTRTLTQQQQQRMC